MVAPPLPPAVRWPSMGRAKQGPEEVEAVFGVYDSHSNYVYQVGGVSGVRAV